MATRSFIKEKTTIFRRLLIRRKIQSFRTIRLIVRILRLHKEKGRGHQGTILLAEVVRIAKVDPPEQLPKAQSTTAPNPKPTNPKTKNAQK